MLAGHGEAVRALAVGLLVAVALALGGCATASGIPLDLVVQTQVRNCLRDTHTQASLRVSGDNVSFSPEVEDHTPMAACLHQKGFAYLGYRTVGAINLFGLPPHHWWQKRWMS
jgi:hypothetical protein